MFKTLLKNKKAQNTAEYALLIALVVAGVIAMQTYAQRALQGRVRAASKFMAEHARDGLNVTAGTEMGNTAQYEPYYLSSGYNVTRSANSTEEAGLGGQANVDSDEFRQRDSGGFQESVYNGINGI